MRMEMMKRPGLIAAGALALGVYALATVGAQQKPPAKPKAPAPTAAGQKALENYKTICQPCHGPEGNSPMPTMSLVDREWKQGTTVEAVAKTIAEGIPGTAMLPNKDKLSKAEILELAKLVRTYNPKVKASKK